MLEQNAVSEERIEAVLWSPVSSITEATEQEKSLFTDKNGQQISEGWFYTFGLEAGENFVAHFTPPQPLKDELRRRSVGVITFRPLNALLPEVKEIRFDHPTIFTSEGKATVRFHSDLTDEERSQYYLYACKSLTSFERRYVPLIEKAAAMHPLLLTCVDLEQNLSACRGKLSCLIAGPAADVNATCIQKAKTDVRPQQTERIRE